LLRVTGLRAHFQVRHQGSRAVLRAVDGVDLRVGAGESLGLVGESGCGKSTVARTIVGLERASAGRVEFDGADITNLRGRRPEVRRGIQMVFQDPYASLNPRMRVGDIVAEPLRVHRLADRAGARREAAALLERVGLPADAARRYPHEFSGGQRQRVGVARALALRPRLILADEPVSALDVSVQAQLLTLLRDIQRERGLSLLFISHNLEVVRYMCDRVAVMYLGRVVEHGPTDEVFARPRHPYTRALLSAVPLVDPVAERRREHVVLSGEIPSPVAVPPGCRFHPRCPVARATCAQAEPPTVTVSAGHEAACVLAGAEEPA